jgi:hypothetical protein
MHARAYTHTILNDLLPAAMYSGSRPWEEVGQDWINYIPFTSEETNPNLDGCNISAYVETALSPAALSLRKRSRQ